MIIYDFIDVHYRINFAGTFLEKYAYVHGPPFIWDNHKITESFIYFDKVEVFGMANSGDTLIPYYFKFLENYLVTNDFILIPKMALTLISEVFSPRLIVMSYYGIHLETLKTNVFIY